MIAKLPRAKRTKLDGYALGTLQPSRALEPVDAEQVAAVLRAANDAGEAVVVFGGGTLQQTSNAPSRYDMRS